MGNLIVSHAIAALLAGLGAWWIVDTRADLEIAKVEAKHSGQVIASQTKALENVAENAKGITDAIRTFKETQQREGVTLEQLQTQLRGLGVVVDGVRRDTASLPGRINAATPATLAKYATACTVVFETMASRGARMGEVGAGIAAKAAGHSADTTLVLDGWPKR